MKVQSYSLLLLKLLKLNKIINENNAQKLSKDCAKGTPVLSTLNCAMRKLVN
jgi:hypothetical protein